MIVLKECLKNNIIPFIIEDSKKAFITEGFQSGKGKRAGGANA